MQCDECKLDDMSRHTTVPVIGLGQPTERSNDQLRLDASPRVDDDGVCTQLGGGVLSSPSVQSVAAVCCVYSERGALP